MKAFTAIFSIQLLTMIFAHGANAGDLVISLSGIPNGKGHIRIALYDDERRWNDDVEARKTLRSCLCVFEGKSEGEGAVTLKYNGKTGAHPIIIPAKEARNGKFAITITGLNPGRYAISLFHDQNDDKVMNMKPLLFFAESPAEPFGLSKNFAPMKSLRAPKFKDCAFTVGDGRSDQGIVLQ